MLAGLPTMKKDILKKGAEYTSLGYCCIESGIMDWVNCDFS
jgi:hypothetical protein